MRCRVAEIYSEHGGNVFLPNIVNLSKIIRRHITEQSNRHYIRTSLKYGIHSYIHPRMSQLYSGYPPPQNQVSPHVPVSVFLFVSP
jgi:hypothetical protein